MTCKHLNNTFYNLKVWKLKTSHTKKIKWYMGKFEMTRLICLSDKCSLKCDNRYVDVNRIGILQSMSCFGCLKLPLPYHTYLRHCVGRFMILPLWYYVLWYFIIRIYKTPYGGFTFKLIYVCNHRTKNALVGIIL